MNLSYLYTYFTAIVVFILIDGAWLKLMTAKFYHPRIGHLLADKPNMGAAALFYLFYIFALCVLIIYPQIKANTPLLQIFLLGGLLGLMAYGTYDFTALALLKDYSVSAALVDFVWGGFVTAMVAVITAATAYKCQWFS